MEARLNITYAGQNGDLVDPVDWDATDLDIRTWAAEAIRTGGVPGIEAVNQVDLTDFKVDRFAATEARPWALISLRPKTAFGV